jgi:predicted SprT family Zn-dependent metalloprotease
LKDLQKLVDETIQDLKQARMRIRPVREWKVGIKRKNLWGNCEALGDGTFIISISEQLLQDDVSDQAAKDTIAHELLHTVEFCMNHGKYWHKLARLVNERCPGYNIKQRTNAEEKGIQIDYKYVLQCLQCGSIAGRHRHSAFVDHPERYICSKCGGKFERIK